MSKLIGLFQGYNEAEMIPYSMGSIYNELDRILFVEGAVEGWFDTSHSTDDTIDVVKGLDVDGKVTFIQVDRYWKSLEEMKNAFLPHLEPADWEVIVDCDEVYMEGDLTKLRKIMDARPQYFEFIPIFMEFYLDLKHLIRPAPGYANITNQRIVRWRPGFFYANHPTLNDPAGNDTSISETYAHQRVVVPDMKIYHLSWLKPRDFMVEKHARYFRTFEKLPPPVALTKGEEKVAGVGSDLLTYDGPLPKILESHPLYGRDIVGGEWPNWLSVLEHRRPELIESPYNITWTPPPKVSVVITCYENLDILQVTLPHWGRQTYTNFEVIVVDDGSNDEEAAQIRKLVEHLGYSYYYNDSGDTYSIASARNIGIWHADGARILFTDSDMIPHEDMIFEHIVEQKHNNITVGSRYHITRDALNSIIGD